MDNVMLNKKEREQAEPAARTRYMHFLYVRSEWSDAVLRFAKAISESALRPVQNEAALERWWRQYGGPEGQSRRTFRRKPVVSADDWMPPIYRTDE